MDLSVRPPADQAIRQNLWAQFVATLTQDPSVVSVTLQVDGSAIEPPGASVPVSDPSQVGFAPIPLTTAAPLVRRGDRLWPLDTEAPISGQDPKSAAPARDDLPAIGAAWTSVAVSADVRDVAALTRDGNNLARWRGRDRYDVAPFGPSLAPPTFDSRGYLWTAIGGRSDGNPVRVISLAEAPATAAPREVSADWLAGEAVEAVKVSPDGERVALLVGTEGGASRLLVAGVVRECCDARHGRGRGDPTGRALAGRDLAVLARHAGCALPDIGRQRAWSRRARQQRSRARACRAVVAVRR